MIIIVKVESKVIAEIRNALQVIQGNAEMVKRMKYLGHTELNTIIEQVKRIDKLLPQVEYEKGRKEKKCTRKSSLS